MMLLAFISVVACSSAIRGFKLQSRTVQSQAVCMSNFTWADTSNGESPCLVAANVDGLCNHNEWLIPALNSSFTYTVPTSNVVSFCTCSWASYNLISACQACQGFPDQISSWTPYIVNCGGQLSESYFPSNLTLPQGILIPFWATMNPTTWTEERFDPATAKNISFQGHADVGTPSPSSNSKSTPIGAIVGGAVGGVIVLLAIVISIYLIRRSGASQSNGGPSSILMANNKHLRSQSDVTAISNNMSMPMDYTSLSSLPMRPPTSPTIRTHGTSIRSFPFFSVRGSTVFSPPSVRQQSPPPGLVPQDETVVEPFVLPPNGTSDRKQANGAYPVYDPPTASPPTAMRVEMRSPTPTQGGRTRYNPPAYTEPSLEAAESSARRSPPTVGQSHAKKGSADTQLSITSSRSGGAARGSGVNIPSMGNVVSQLVPPRTGINPQSNQHDVTASANFAGHGRQLSGNTSSNTSLNGKRRPTDMDSFNARDIA